MKKRMLCLLVLIIALVSVSQMAVLAADLSDRAIIYVGNTQITNENAADVLGNGSVSYDIENDQLILNDTQISVNEGYGIHTEGDLTIVLQGQNHIASAEGSSINVKGNLTIIGEGSLEAEGVGYGIYSGNNLSIGGDVNITVRVNSSFSDCYGIYSYNDMMIGEGADVTVKMGSALKYCYGIYSYDDLTIGDNAVVTTEAGYALERSCGMYAISNLTINGSANVTTIGVDNEMSADAYNDSYGIRTTHLYMNGGVLTASGGKSNACSDGIFTQDFNMTAGTVYAAGNTAYKGPSNGIEATKSVTISGGTITASGGDTANDKSCGIRTAGDMTVTDGMICVSSGNAADTCGIETDNLILSGGSAFVDAAKGSNSSRGIQASNLISICGGSLEVNSGGAAAQSFGLQGFKVGISGGIVSVSNGDANVSNGIWAFESVDIADGTVDITSGGEGIYVPFGNVNIDSTKVTAGIYTPALQGTNVKIKADGDHGIYAGTGLTISEALNIDGTVTKVEESYWTLLDTAGNPMKNIEIAPLTYKVRVMIPDSTYTMGFDVPVGKSVNEVYCEIWDVNDFSELLRNRKEGYILEGCYLDESYAAGNEFSFDEKVTSDITIYTKWKENPVWKVYNAYAVLQDAVADTDLVTLETAVEKFAAVIDVFNEMDEDGFAELALLLSVENGEAAYNRVLSDWIDANVVLAVSSAYSAFLSEPMEEVALAYIEMIDGYDEMYQGDRTLIIRFISDIDVVYAQAEKVIKEKDQQEKQEDQGESNTKDDQDKPENPDTNEEEDKETTNVNTGDSSNLLGWSILAVISFALLMAMVVIKRKSRNEKL